ncbi:hypothetical protein A2U01_0038453, partial [Trifolium medium]|nr:hypothetical protein [Trifolium medium]
MHNSLPLGGAKEQLSRISSFGETKNPNLFTDVLPQMEDDREVENLR